MRIEKAPGLLEQPYTIHASEEEFQKIMYGTPTENAKEILLKQMARLQELSEKMADLMEVTYAAKAMAKLAVAFAAIHAGNAPNYIPAAEAAASKS